VAVRNRAPKAPAAPKSAARKPVVVFPRLPKASELYPIAPAPATRARQVQGIHPVTYTVPPPRYRQLGQVQTIPTFGNGRLAAAKAETSVTLTPPPHVVRRQAGLGLPSGVDLLEAVAGSLGGALVTAVFIGLVGTPGAKAVASLTTGSLGLLLASTSPPGTIPSELGMGATAASAMSLYLQLTGQYSQAAAPVWDPAAGTVSFVKGG